jgi:hypothetical protein
MVAGNTVDRDSPVPLYVYGRDVIGLEQISSGTITYLHHDQQGSTRLLTGSTGTVTGSTTFGAYGNTTPQPLKGFIYPHLVHRPVPSASLPSSIHPLPHAPRPHVADDHRSVEQVAELSAWHRWWKQQGSW